jgi:hypothetical protein
MSGRVLRRAASACPMHAASLRAQDIIRWGIIAVIILGIVAKFTGLDRILIDLLGGLL